MNPYSYTEVLPDTLYAFWEYDQFPFVLGGPITRMREDGRIETSNFGKGNFFRPLKIVPCAEGTRIREELKRLELDYERARNTLQVDYLAKAVGICDFIPRST